MASPSEWREIERQAHDDMLAGLPSGEPERGASIAWVECRFGHTDGFSDVHRVGPTVAGTPLTTCGLVIPEPIKLVPLTPNLVRVLTRCMRCELAKREEIAA